MTQNGESKVWDWWLSADTPIPDSGKIGEPFTASAVEAAVKVLSERPSARAGKLLVQAGGVVTFPQVSELAGSGRAGVETVLSATSLARLLSDSSVSGVVDARAWIVRVKAAGSRWVPAWAAADGLMGIYRPTGNKLPAAGTYKPKSSRDWLWFSGDAESWSVQDLVRLAASVSVRVASEAVVALHNSGRLTRVVWEWWRFHAASAGRGYWSEQALWQVPYDHMLSALASAGKRGAQDRLRYLKPVGSGYEPGPRPTPDVPLPALVDQIPADLESRVWFYNSYATRDTAVAERLLEDWDTLGSHLRMLRPFVVVWLRDNHPALFRRLVEKVGVSPVPGVFDMFTQEDLTELPVGTVLRNVSDVNFCAGLLDDGDWWGWQTVNNPEGLPYLLKLVSRRSDWPVWLTRKVLTEGRGLVEANVMEAVLREPHPNLVEWVTDAVPDLVFEAVEQMVRQSWWFHRSEPVFWDNVVSHPDFRVRALLGFFPVMSGLTPDRVVESLLGFTGDGGVCSNLDTPDLVRNVSTLISTLPGMPPFGCERLLMSASPTVVVAARSWLLDHSVMTEPEIDEVTRLAAERLPPETRRAYVSELLGEDTQLSWFGGSAETRDRYRTYRPLDEEATREIWEQPPRGFVEDPRGWVAKHPRLRVYANTNTRGGVTAVMLRDLLDSDPSVPWADMLDSGSLETLFHTGVFDSWDMGKLTRLVPAGHLFARFPTGFWKFVRARGCGLESVLETCRSAGGSATANSVLSLLI